MCILHSMYVNIYIYICCVRVSAYAGLNVKCGR